MYTRIALFPHVKRCVIAIVAIRVENETNIHFQTPIRRLIFQYLTHLPLYTNAPYSSDLMGVRETMSRSDIHERTQN